MNHDQDHTIAKFDRIRAGLRDVALFTQPSTIQYIQPLTGKSETYIIETCRYPEHGGDYIFLQAVDESGTIRLALPPKVAAAFASQRDALTTRSRKRAAKARVELMTDEQKQAVRERLAKARGKRGKKRSK